MPCCVRFPSVSPRWTRPHETSILSSGDCMTNTQKVKQKLETCPSPLCALLQQREGGWTQGKEMEIIDNGDDFDQGDVYSNNSHKRGKDSSKLQTRRSFTHCTFSHRTEKSTPRVRSRIIVVGRTDERRPVGGLGPPLKERRRKRKERRKAKSRKAAKAGSSCLALFRLLASFFSCCVVLFCVRFF